MEKGFSYRRARPCRNLGFALLASRRLKTKQKSVVLSHPVCDTLLQPPWETDTGHRQSSVPWTNSLHHSKYEELSTMCCIYMWTFPNSIHIYCMTDVRHSINTSSTHHQLINEVTAVAYNTKNMNQNHI